MCVCKRQIYKKLLKVIVAMVLKCMKCTYPNNRKIESCMKKQKKFQNMENTGFLYRGVPIMSSCREALKIIS